MKNLTGETFKVLPAHAWVNKWGQELSLDSA